VSNKAEGEDLQGRKRVLAVERAALSVVVRDLDAATPGDRKAIDKVRGDLRRIDRHLRPLGPQVTA